MGWLLLVVICGYLYYQYSKLCHISGHDFQNNGNVDICKKCGLIKRKVRR